MKKGLLLILLLNTFVLSEGVFPLDEISRPLIYPKGTWILNGSGSGYIDNKLLRVDGFLGIIVPTPTYSITSQLSYSVSMIHIAFIQNTLSDSVYHVQILNGPSIVCNLGLTNLSFTLSKQHSTFLNIQHIYAFYGAGIKAKIPLNNSIWFEPDFFLEAKNIDAFLPSVGLFLGYQISKRTSLSLSHSIKFLYPTGYNSFSDYSQKFHMYNSTYLSGTIGINQAFSIGCFIGLKSDGTNPIWFPVGVNVDFGWLRVK